MVEPDKIEKCLKDQFSADSVLKPDSWVVHRGNDVLTVISYHGFWIALIGKKNIVDRAKAILHKKFPRTAIECYSHTDIDFEIEMAKKDTELIKEKIRMNDEIIEELEDLHKSINS